MLKKRFFKTKDECEVTFQFDGAEAETAAVVCEANNWQPVAMKKQKSGDFVTKLRLPVEGQFQFRYLVDGDLWLNDDSADAYWPNQFGEKNSVVFTGRNGS